MKLLCSKILALQLLLFVVAAIAVLGACGSEESAPAVAIAPTETAAPATVEEEWPPAPRPTPTPGAMLGLPTPEPSSLADEAYAVLNTLTTQYSPRESGTDQEKNAALYLQKNLDAIGYDTSLQKFYSPEASWSVVHLVSGEGEPLMNSEVSHLHTVPVVIAGHESSTGLLTHVGGALQEDIPDHGLEGRIPVIDLGTTTFREQVDRVAEAGAAGALITSAELDDILIPYTYHATIPVIWLSSADARAVLRLIEESEVSATIAVEKIDSAESQNVVADMRKSASDDRVVILGAHYDTVEDTQGASDNRSGLATLLTVATHIAERDYPFEVQIVLFRAQKQGLFGSRHYAENMSPDEIAGTIAMMNFDALGSGS